MQTRTYNKFIVFCLISFNICAEYRVYQYSVSPKSQSRTPSSHIITSTLDPISYTQYHGGSDALRVDLLKTWMCKGHTGGKDHCQDPTLSAIDQVNKMGSQKQ